MIRKHEGPAITFLLSACLAAVTGAAMFVEGAKVRRCPAHMGGKPLLSVNMVTQECRYGREPARPLDIYTPAELRSIAIMRERLSRLSPSGRTDPPARAGRGTP